MIKFKRKARLSTALVLGSAVALALSACSSAGTTNPEASSTGYVEATSGELNFYTWSDYFPVELLAKFKEETGITVNIDYYDTNESLEAKLRASDGAGYDVVVPSDYMIQILKNDGLLLQMNAAEFPNGGNIEPEFLDVYFDEGREYSAPYLYGTTSFVFDSAVIPEAEWPTSWADYFAPPASAGGVGIMNDMVEGVNSALRVTGGDFCTTDGSQLQAAQDLLTGFKPDVGTISSDGIIERVSAGEESMAMMWNGAAYRAIQDRPSLRYVYPPEGMALWQDNFAIPSGAVNVDQAKTFINWMMNPENMAVAVNVQGYGSGIAGTNELMSPELASSSAITMPAGYTGAKPVKPCNNEELTNYSKIWEAFKG
jgi:spermidine/putrescine transport system substrate-binding protein